MVLHMPPPPPSPPPFPALSAVDLGGRRGKKRRGAAVSRAFFTPPSPSLPPSLFAGPYMAVVVVVQAQSGKMGGE